MKKKKARKKFKVSKCKIGIIKKFNSWMTSLHIRYGNKVITDSRINCSPILWTEKGYNQ